MTMFRSLEVSATGLTAERMRMDVTAENLANAQTTKGVDGQPYRRKEVVLQQVGGGPSFGSLLSGAMGPRGGAGGVAPGGVQVAGIVEDQTPLKQVYDPSNPDADARGYVQMPNVEPVEEMVDLISAQRAYEANVTAMQTAKQMFAKTLELLR
jgi:flagellar basal-body rod protein FlgC